MWWRRFGDTPKERLLRMVYWGEWENWWFSQIIEEVKNPNRNLESVMDWEKVYDGTKELPKREKEILYLRAGVDSMDGRPKTLQKIAEEFSLSQARVRQIEDRAHRRLRSKIPFETVFLEKKR